MATITSEEIREWMESRKVRVGRCLTLAYSAWAVYWLRVDGWWITLLTLCVMAASIWVTVARIDLLEMYRAMGYSEREIEMMKQFGSPQGRLTTVMSVAGALPMLGVLLFVTRYFRRSS